MQHSTTLPPRPFDCSCSDTTLLGALLTPGFTAGPAFSEHAVPNIPHALPDACHSIFALSILHTALAKMHGLEFVFISRFVSPLFAVFATTALSHCSAFLRMSNIQFYFEHTRSDRSIIVISKIQTLLSAANHSVASPQLIVAGASRS